MVTTNQSSPGDQVIPLQFRDRNLPRRRRLSRIAALAIALVSAVGPLRLIAMWRHEHDIPTWFSVATATSTILFLLAAIFVMRTYRQGMRISGLGFVVSIAICAWGILRGPSASLTTMETIRLCALAILPWMLLLAVTIELYRCRPRRVRLPMV